jgi:hypothetical protein
MSTPSDEPWSITLLVRPDGTYDYRYAAGQNDFTVMNALREIADQIEHGHTLGPTVGVPDLGGPT